DHWFLDRGPGGRWTKYRRFCKDFGRVAREIRAIRYDVAVDLRAYFPNALPLLAKADIPIRIGYSRVFFAPMLTHPRRFLYRRAHETTIQSDLLQALSVPDESFADLKFRLPAPSAQALSQADHFLME